MHRPSVFMFVIKKNSRIKITFISKPAEKICGGLKDFCPEKLLPSQMSELTTGNLGGRCKPQWGPEGRAPGKLGN